MSLYLPRKDSSDRRDQRNAKDSNETPKQTQANAKKSTRHWCRGKVGVQHKTKCVDYRDVKLASKDYPNMYKGWKILVCTSCGKELEHFFPRPLDGDWKPDWVTP